MALELALGAWALRHVREPRRRSSNAGPEPLAAELPLS
jgi:hypothetical protein